MPVPEETIQFVADRGDARARLDQVLVRRITAISRMSRSVAQQWIEGGAVDVDGRPARRPASRVREGAEITVRLPAGAVKKATPAAEPGDLDILFEDVALVAVNKPPGVVVHPSYKQLSGTLLNAVLWRVRDSSARPGILTRLDKDTSGVVVVALDATVHATMQRDSAEGLVRKEYLAIVNGRPRPARGAITAPLARDPADRRRVIVADGGAPSETRYEVVAEGAGTSLVRCQLVTGRTHQIRVHLASRGCPVLGDRLYGTAADEIARQALHAWRIALPHPTTRQPLSLVAPFHADFVRALDLLALAAPASAT
jgi:23S rRNA pseudouridine1911/1915/1917 synthase